MAFPIRIYFHSKITMTGSVNGDTAPLAESELSLALKLMPRHRVGFSVERPCRELVVLYLGIPYFVRI